MPAFATATAAFTSCYVVKVGASARTRPCASTARPAIAHQNAQAPGQDQLRDDRKPATRSNETWAMDFVRDQLATGHKLRMLTIVNILCRFSPALASRFTFCGADVVAVLERACKEVGFPATSRVYEGSEFVSRDLNL